MIARRDAIHPHVPGHADALLGLPALTAPRGARRKRARRAMFALGAVTRGLAAEVMTLHHAGEAFALARSDHVNELHVVEGVHAELRAGGDVRRFLQPNFG